jgi:hypothetical protein
MIEFPIRLISDLDDINLAEDVSLRRIDDHSRLDLLGIESVELDENGRLKSCVTRGPPIPSPIS